MAWPAIMVTDTTKDRNRCYHRPCDVAGRLDYERLAVVTTGIAGAVAALAAREGERVGPPRVVHEKES